MTLLILLQPAAGSTPISAADTATGTDAATLAATRPAADTAAGTDAATLSATSAATDIGTGTDSASFTASLVATDTAAATDTATVNTGAAPIAASDTATALDTATVIVEQPTPTGGSYLPPRPRLRPEPKTVQVYARDTARARDRATTAASLGARDTARARDNATSVESPVPMIGPDWLTEDDELLLLLL